jgi:A/G-specific adenine glycosylase
MLEIPGTSWRETGWTEAEALAQAPIALVWQPVAGEAKHVFTHFGLTLSVRTAIAAGREGARWMRTGEARAALPTVFATALDRATAAID